MQIVSTSWLRSRNPERERSVHVKAGTFSAPNWPFSHEYLMMRRGGGNSGMALFTVWRGISCLSFLFFLQCWASDPTRSMLDKHRTTELHLSPSLLFFENFTITLLRKALQSAFPLFGFSLYIIQAHFLLSFILLNS